ncbi:Ribosomal protein L7Ae/L30e/S12e/Gadd45 [Macleaya cordata]|uniref:Ribosomal protein L7Ae/L30e/S12e/Gadd45 n=1 Tax=Macleaya cordata TaxID=56857 RepID=A0A200Q466_MACCD|nr:Ribosomal protein L7Ae/L30e/S12e/Gadd45 [Macleaya cordata]
MRMRNKKPKSSLEDPISVSTYQQQHQQQQQQQQLSNLGFGVLWGLLRLNCYEGERLILLLKSLNREIESAKLSNGNLLEKLWIKQQFSVGVNDVTRTLERMTPNAELGCSASQPSVECCERKASSVQLQAVILAYDCNPRWLTKHIPSLASSRRVPLIFVRDKKGGSLRLGELVKLKTTIAIGANGSGINKLIEEILLDNGNVVGTGLSEGC